MFSFVNQMSITTSYSKEIIFLLVGMLILSFPLFTQGMFMDGTIYAAVASNLANGSGSIWELKFSETLLMPFYEHPPLAIWMESIVHRLLGDHLISERIYSLLMWFLNAILLVAIWKQIKPESRIAWVPLFLWSITPIIIWSFSNNMLENTMGVFVSSSVLFLLIGLKQRTFIWSSLGGIMLALAFMSKGFVGLFPLALPVLIYLFGRKESSLLKVIQLELGMILGLMIGMLPFLLQSSGLDYLSIYIENQVVKSVESAQTVSNRFEIVKHYVEQLIVSFGVIIVVYLSFRKKEKIAFQPRTYWSWIFVVISLLGVLPIMVSLKQREFYIVTVFPMAIIGLVLLFEPYFLELDKRIEKFVVHRTSLILLTLLGMNLCLSLVASNFYKRDKEVIESVYLLMEEEGREKVYDTSHNIRGQWHVMAYLSRIAKISVQVGVKSDSKLLSIDEESVDAKVIGVFKLQKLE